MARATRSQWMGRVERWRESGLTAAAFARKYRVSESQLRWWKWRLGEIASQVSIVPAEASGTGASALSPLTFVEMTTSRATASFEVVLASGVRVLVPTQFDGASLERLLDVLERRQ
jgi:hypothetical protein